MIKDHEEHLIYIYETLKYLRFPALTNQDSESEQQRPASTQTAFKQIGRYIQGGDSRLTLLEWLVGIVSQSMLPRGKFPTEERVQNLKSALSAMGLLPVSKHSKNMDYDRYIEGLIGAESSVLSIVRICQFVRQLVDNRKKDYCDNKFNGVVGELCQNKAELVNVGYDPFPLTFPPAYTELPQHDFNEKFQAFRKKLLTAKEDAVCNADSEASEAFLDIPAEFKQRYASTLQQFVRVVQTHSSEPTGVNQEKHDSQRLIRMDTPFVNSYRNMRKLTTLPAQKSGECQSLLQQIALTLDSL